MYSSKNIFISIFINIRLRIDLIKKDITRCDVLLRYYIIKNSLSETVNAIFGYKCVIFRGILYIYL